MATLKEKIIHILHLFDRPDLVQTKMGYLAGHLPNTAPYAYFLKLNNGLPDSEIEQILAIAGQANSQSIRDLYSAFNGLDIGMSKFSVYGQIVQIDRSDYLNVQNIPFSIETIQTFGRPAFAPEKGCIIATSKISDEGMKFHLIDPSGRVQVGCFDKCADVVEEFVGIEEWLLTYVGNSMKLTNT